MIKIRLTRNGVKKAPFYRVVAIESSRKRNGKPLDIIGFWKPEKNEVKIDKKLLAAWVLKGAQVTDAVKKILK